MLALTYAQGGNPLERLAQRGNGVISVYAQGRDYHDVLKGKLKRLAQWLAHEAKAGSRFSPIPHRSWRSRSPRGRGLAGRASTPISFRANWARGFSSAQF